MKKKVTSVFDEIMQELATVTNSEETENELLNIQKLQVRIVKAHNNGYLNQYEYKALNMAASLIRDNIRFVLRG